MVFLKKIICRHTLFIIIKEGKMYAGGVYGSGMSSYGGYRSNSYGMMNTTAMNNANIQNQDPRRPPHDGRKNFMEEYFKMMSGLQSMVQIGFSLLAFSSFTSQTWQLLKKVSGFLFKTASKLFTKLIEIIGNSKINQLIKKMLMISANSKNELSMKNKILVVLRVLSVLVIGISYWLKGTVERECTEKKEELLRQYQQRKEKEEKIDQGERQIFGQNSIILKDGYI